MGFVLLLLGYPMTVVGSFITVGAGGAATVAIKVAQESKKSGPAKGDEVPTAELPSDATEAETVSIEDPGSAAKDSSRAPQ